MITPGLPPSLITHDALNVAGTPTTMIQIFPGSSSSFPNPASESHHHSLRIIVEDAAYTILWR
jgi:hypothetical protein